jgi:allantoate deiminase
LSQAFDKLSLKIYDISIIKGVIILTINGQRLWNHIQELGEIGKTEQNGITRLSFTETEKQAKTVVKRYMEEAGLEVREDEMGNVIGRKEGKIKNSPGVVIGSHIDSVFNGGIFDGPAGVLSGVEVAHTLKDQGHELDYPLEVVAFTDEEGARFSSGMLGSKAFVGEITHEDLFDFYDQDGVNVAQAMDAMGYDHRNVSQAKRNPEDIKAYLELHIEQGKVLETNGLPVGVVTGIVGVLWLKVTLKGEAGHAGTTPMGLRRDPLAAAAEAIQHAEVLARKEPGMVATVGRISAAPGGINIIPGSVEFTIDVRDVSLEKIEAFTEQFTAYLESICAERGIEFEIEELHRLKPALCSPELIQKVTESIEEQGIRPLELVSGAGHDGMVLSAITDIVMVFVRSKDGISHNPKEWTSKEDLEEGAEVLYKTVLKL